MKKAALLCLLPLWVSGAAHAGLFSDDEARANLKALQDRVTKLETQVNDKGMVELLGQIDALKNEITQLRGQLEVLNHDMEVTQKRQKDLYVDLDTRLRLLEKPAPAADPAPAPEPETKGKKGKKGEKADKAEKADKKAGRESQAAADPSAETSAYQAALDRFKAGDYQGAAAAFQSFVDTYPKSAQAPAAQYWIGNSHYNLRDFNGAVAAQQKLIAQYPGSGKIPDAMLNMASSQQGLGDETAARKTLEELVAKYPVSNAAELAKKRLAASKP